LIDTTRRDEKKDYCSVVSPTFALVDLEPEAALVAAVGGGPESDSDGARRAEVGRVAVGQTRRQVGVSTPNHTSR